MFSNRFDWQLESNALSLLLDKKRTLGQRIFDLTASNPTVVGLTYKARDILSALATPEMITYDPDPAGLLSARQAIADYYMEMGVSVAPEALFLTAGTSEAYAALFKLLGNPGDEILVPRPGYPLLAHLAGFESLRSISYPLRYDDRKGWSVDLDVLSALVTPKTRAIVMINPNNPTGSYLKTSELEALNAVCRRHDLAMIVDEVFNDYAAESAAEVRTVAKNSGALTFVLNGISKMLALPQLKLGWILIVGPAGRSREARQNLGILLDFYLNVSAPVQHAARKLLAGRRGIQRRIKDRIALNSRFLEEQTARTGNCRLRRREGGWYAILEIDDGLSDEDRVLKLLNDDDTLVHPGFFYDFNQAGIVVVSLLPPEEMFRTGISRLIRRFGRR